MVAAFCRGRVVVDPQIGGKFELFEGNISGQFLQLVRYIIFNKSIFYLCVVFFLKMDNPCFKIILSKFTTVYLEDTLFSNFV